MKSLISYFLAHLSQRLIGELIVYTHALASVRPSLSTISNIFSSETAWPMKAKFYMEPPWVGRGNESLFTAFGSHDQDGCHAHM